jgi:SAM-dependent methyltransferase
LYTYDRQFYKYINRGSLDSASQVVPLIQKLIPRLESVLDVGCGAGAWLSVWKTAGVRVTGLDGDYVDRGALLIDAAEFTAADISRGFSLGDSFDLAQCLEVAEHLPEAAGRALVGSLCEHADVVLFSAAAPGQGGENHINEQAYEYWRDLFANQGFQMYDAIRQALANNKRVMPWYRYNTFLYVRGTALPALHASLSESAVAADQLPRDISPLLYRLRKRLVGVMPLGLMTRLAVLKKHLIPLLPGAR